MYLRAECLPFLQSEIHKSKLLLKENQQINKVSRLVYSLQISKFVFCGFLGDILYLKLFICLKLKNVFYKKESLMLPRNYLICIYSELRDPNKGFFEYQRFSRSRSYLLELIVIKNFLYKYYPGNHN